MTAATPATTRTSTDALVRWLWLGSMLLWVVILHVREWPPAVVPHEQGNWPLARVDSATFAMAGELLRTGGAPYLSYWDHKPPLVHLLNAAALTVSGGHTWSVWLLSLLAVLGAFGLGYTTLVRTCGRGPAILGMTFFAVALTAPYAANHTETYVLPLQWAAVMLVLSHPVRERAALVGLGLGAIGTLSFLLRPNLIGAAACAWLLATVLLLSARHRGAWLKLLGGSLVGLACVAAPLLAYLAWEGALGAFFDQVFRYNVVYAGSTWKLRFRAMLTGVDLLASHGSLLLPLAGWLWATVTLVRGARQGSRALLLLGVLWLPVEVVLATMAGRSHANYFLPVTGALAFATALLGSAALSTLASGALPAQLRRVGAALVVAMTVVPAADVLLDVRDHGLVPTRIEQAAATARYVRMQTRPDAPIFVWGHAADLYLLSGRPPASRYIYPLPLLTPGYADEARVAAFLTELKRIKPALIVDASNPGENHRPGEDLVPSLARWDPEWRVPDPRRAEFSHWRGPSYWSMTPELEAFYDYVHRHYRPTARVGPRGWVIYEPLLEQEDAPSAG